MNYRNPKLGYFTIGAILVLNVLIKSIGLTSNCLSLDEPFSVFYAQHDVKDIVHELLKGNNPPLWEILLHFWIKIFGNGLLSVRFLPMLFSSIAAVFVFLIGRNFFSYKIGLVSSLLFSFSKYELFFSHEARVYPLFCMLTCISVYTFLSILKNPKPTKFLVILVVTNATLCYAHYFGFFVLILELLWSCFYFRVAKKAFYYYITSFGIVLVTYIPILNVFLGRLKLSVIHGTWLPPVEGDTWFFLLASWANNRVNLILFLFPILLSSIILIIRFFKKNYRNADKWIVYSWFWIPFLFMFGISFRIPMFLDRYLIFISPAFFLILPMSMYVIKVRPLVRKVILGLFVLLMVISFKFNVSNGRDFDKMVAKIKELRSDNADVYLCPPWFDLNVMYYFDSKIFNNPYSFNILREKERIYPVYNGNEVRASTLANRNPVIFVDLNSQSAFPGNTIFDVISKNYKVSSKFEFEAGFTVYYFHE